MKKKHAHYWCEDTQEEDMCLTEEDMCQMSTDCGEEMQMKMDMKMEMPMMHHSMHHPMHTHMHKNMMLAHAYVPWQCYTKAFNPREALCKGTLFPELFGVYKVPM